tara:strand:- start:249 stop:521 length:273 start_codon:yes stop_codon:yes gene_type:complete
MNKILPLILVFLFSSNLFAERVPVHVYEMLLTERGLSHYRSLPDDMKFRIMCIDGYRYLFTSKGVTQMKENYKGKYRHLECPLTASNGIE